MTSEKIEEVNVVIDETRNEVQITMENVLARGENLEELEEKSGKLQNESEMFHKQAKKTKWKMWKEKCKANAVLLIVTIVIVVIIIAVIVAIL